MVIYIYTYFWCIDGVSEIEWNFEWGNVRPALETKWVYSSRNTSPLYESSKTMSYWCMLLFITRLRQFIWQIDVCFTCVRCNDVCKFAKWIYVNLIYVRLSNIIIEGIPLQLGKRSREIFPVNIYLYFTVNT